MHAIGNTLLPAKLDGLIKQMRRAVAAANKNKLCCGVTCEELRQRLANRELIFPTVRIKVGDHSQQRSILSQSQFGSKCSAG